jgi:hypothetical protein
MRSVLSTSLVSKVLPFAAALVALGLPGCAEPPAPPGSDPEPPAAEARQGVVSATACLNIWRQGASGAVLDAQIANKAPYKNYGTSGTFNTGLISGQERQALLQFDLSAIPQGPATTITNASLTLALGLPPSGPSTIEVHRVTAPWSEPTVDWLNFNGAFDPTVEATFGNGAPFVNFNIHPLVTGWVQGAFPNDGILLVDPSGASTNFWSSEQPNINLRPQLNVCFHVTCDPGFADCNSSGLDGCEVDLQTSPTHCGACGNACSAPNATAACVNGACGVGACNPGFADCNGLASDGCELAIAAETCNGLDDDCNGQIDEGLGSLTCGTGACQVTVPSCAGGQPQTCVPLAPQAEICDGLVDDDCDGVVDNGCACVNGATQPCYTGAPATLGIGACTAGTQTCVQGQWGACVGEQTPAAETCNGIDDDCNGQVDEGLGQTTCGVGACQATTPSCVNGQPAACVPFAPQPEVCGNGVDDNCDGAVDEGCGAVVTCSAGSECPSGVCTGGVCAPSCGAGAFCPTAATNLCGTLSYSSLYIPAGVTVGCAPGCANPLVIDVSGDVVIAGTLSLDGANGAAGSATYMSPNGAAGGAGGLGKCGGRNGGAGGHSQSGSGTIGLGNAGGGAGISKYFFNFNTVFYNGGNGSGGGYATPGILGFVNTYTGLSNPPGGTFGNAQLTTLLGGSGGGGGSGGLGGASTGYGGYGGGAGGGALKIVAGGFIAISSTGAVRANGGIGGTQNTGAWASGGAGSGGAVWLSAATIQNLGLVSAKGGVNGALNGAPANAGAGGDGRIRVDTTGAVPPTGTFQPAIGYTGVYP